MEAKEKEGVGGWLAFLIIGLVVLGPLLNFATNNNQFANAEHSYPQLAASDIWQGYKQIFWIVDGLFIAAGLATGVILATKRTPTAVRIAQIGLWFFGPVATIVLGLLLPTFYFRKSLGAESVGQTIGNTLASLILAAVWTWYLAKSKRVKNTYFPKENGLELHGVKPISDSGSTTHGNRFAGAAILLIMVLNFGLGFVQLAAIGAGFQYWLDWNKWICAFIAGVLVFGLRMTLLTVPVGIVGAHFGWGLNWLAATAVFVGPFIALFVVSMMAGLGQKILRW